MKILVVDDERIQRETLSAILADQNYSVVVCSHVEEAIRVVREQSFDLVLTDFKMPDGTGLDVAAKTLQYSPDASVFIMTAYADVASVIDAMRLGVVDYLLKPINVEHLLKKIAMIVNYRQLQSEVRELRCLVNKTEGFGLIGDSEVMKSLRKTIRQVALTKGTVLITGESGTGKEVAARMIHAASPDSAKRFIAVNCAAIPENLLESEFFGHKKGAFTGATSDKDGLFKVANGGTLFLDEIGELPKSLQAKLLRVLQEREITPLGDSKPIKIELRLVAATNRQLEDEVRQGTFRQDLFYRINVVQLKMPSLRQHPEDIIQLAQHFIDKYVREFSKRPVRIGNLAARKMLKYSWPGNIRELENVIERAIILGVENDTLEVEHLPDHVKNISDISNSFGESGESTLNLELALNSFTAKHIAKVLEVTKYDKKEAAKLLGLGLSSLYRKLDELHIFKDHNR